MKAGGLLLIAQSARMLAQSAARAGFNACTIDYFADADTRRHAARCLALAPREQGFDAAELLQAASRIAPGAPLIYGSGIDTRPELVEKLEKSHELLGNPPEILRLAHSPKRFFRLLDELAIAYPDTRFAPPACLQGWLIKPSCGEGGKRVGFAATKRPPPENAYYQRHIPGDAHSALFIADGRQARLVGLNTQWTSGHDPARPFLFGGAVNRADLDSAQQARVEGHVSKLTAALGLVGLNSLDFMLENGEPKVLELNPRPSATMALYDEDYPRGLLVAHIAACWGQLPGKQPEGPIRAFKTVYAPQTLSIKAGGNWPDGCADIPMAGAAIPAGQPLCSLQAQSRSRAEVEDLLNTREAELLHGLGQRPGDA